MFYFSEINGKKILKSDFYEKAFFTTRGFNPQKDVPKSFGRIIAPSQTHSSNVEFVSENSEYPNTDGLILTDINDTICLKFADCTPLVFYDTKQKIGAISHAGWRGVAAQIAVKTVRKMKSDPEDIIAIIGPAISICCYEVSEEVRDSLLKTVKNNADLYNDRHVDLKKINARQLEEIGVKIIDICPYCTSCNNDLFYSYRKENGTKERHYALLTLG